MVVFLDAFFPLDAEKVNDMHLMEKYLMEKGY
jgi:hypothetical protein